jgi:uncharacterized protein (UPF0335 family)
VAQSIVTESESNLLAIVDRLGRLEGLITGLQASISQSQASTAAFLSRIERLEQRQVELERHMVTSADIAGLTAKVDQLVSSDASRKGGTAMATWSFGTAASWAAVIIALLALVGVGINREGIHQNRQQLEQRP